MRAMEEGGGVAISLNPDELQHFAERALAISEIFQNRISPQIERLSSLRFYEDGEAADAFSIYRKALERLLDIGDFYMRSAQMLMLVAEVMSAQDEALASSFDEGAVQ
ncbi:hypothetical protein [Sporolactobacillus laevolacticus]|uniref:Uncharacterized protein n=1 Tax=Sporolactobacillus laevolacticus DSM 442 TaxID=1395513 RepID=V6J014_9BACL|nr:hypothetical protein [Sporolactobacillus laevolacticus]EST12481.1 hypothetical protein P343_06980 [Sporolactobacillus laevolacticus DSM 442]